MIEKILNKERKGKRSMKKSMRKLLNVTMTLLLIASMIIGSNSVWAFAQDDHLNAFTSKVDVKTDISQVEKNEEFTVDISFQGKGSELLDSEMVYTVPEELQVVDVDKTVDITDGDNTIKDNQVTINGDKLVIKVNEEALTPITPAKEEAEPIVDEETIEQEELETIVEPTLFEKVKAADNVTFALSLKAKLVEAGETNFGNGVFKTFAFKQGPKSISTKCDGVTITVSAVDEGALLPGTELKVKSISDEEAKEIIEESENVEVKDIKAFDIMLVVNGEEVQPDGTVEVTFTNTGIETDDGVVTVTHLDDNDNIEESEEGKPSNLSIEVEHFSTYIIWSVDKTNAIEDKYQPSGGVVNQNGEPLAAFDFHAFAEVVDIGDVHFYGNLAGNAVKGGDNKNIGADDFGNGHGVIYIQNWDGNSGANLKVDYYDYVVLGAGTEILFSDNTNKIKVRFSNGKVLDIESVSRSKVYVEDGEPGSFLNISEELKKVEDYAAYLASTSAPGTRINFTDYVSTTNNDGIHNPTFDISGVNGNPIYVTVNYSDLKKFNDEAQELKIISQGQQIIFNVVGIDGDTVNLNKLKMSVNNVSNEEPNAKRDGKVLWNFNGYTGNITIASEGYWMGSIVAPKANVTFGALNGSVISKNATHVQAESHKSDYNPDTNTSFPVKKFWIDNKENHDPITVTLKRRTRNGSYDTKGQQAADDPNFSEQVTLSDENDWQHVFENLEKTDSYGDFYEYYIEEVNVPDGYQSTVNGGIIINTLESTNTKLTIEKKWIDASGKELSANDLPDSIRVQLLIYGKTIAEIKSEGLSNYGLDNPQNYPGLQELLNGDGIVTLNKDNGWSYTWDPLPAKSGKGWIDYSVKEIDVPEGYVSSNPEFVGDDTYVITNTKNITNEDKGSLEITKSFTGDNLTDEQKAGITFTVTGPDGETVGVFTYGEMVVAGGKIVLTDLVPGEYTVVESRADVEGYTVTTTYKVNGEAAGNGTVEVVAKTTATVEVTNDYIVDKTLITVNKVWVDNDNQDGIRPESIEVQLLANGEAYGDVVVLSAENNWTYTWTDLPQKASGQDIVYTVQEISDVPGYTSSVDGFTITNTHETATVNKAVTKVWDDDNNRDGLRPESIEVQLLADGEPTGDAVVLNADNNWTYTWTDLPEKANGQDIVYTVVEITDVPGYTSSVDGFTITNTHETATVNKAVTKVWNDDNNRDGLRPESIEVQLLADGKAYGEKVVLSADNNWTYTWTDLPEKANGEDIVYTVVEITDVQGYTSSVDGFTITNTHETATVDKAVTKIWVDGENQDGIRPGSIEVQLLADGKVYGDAVVLSADNDWAYTWTDLPAKAAGQDIVYTVAEISDVKGYTTAYAELGIATIITNTHETAEVSKTVTKVWDDDNNRDGLRPESIEVQLLADGEAYGDAVVLSADNNWTYTWTGLPQKANGKDIVYTVAEISEVEGYTTSYSDDTFTITNAHEIATVEKAVRKVWDDGNNKDRLRPGSIQVQLFANGEAYGDVITLNARNNWAYQWSGLPQKANGKDIAYTVQEVSVVPGYTVRYDVNGDITTITNSHIPNDEITTSKTASLTIYKIDQDYEALSGAEFRMIKDDGTIVYPIKDDTVFTFTGLTDGFYTVEEYVTPEGYEGIGSFEVEVRDGLVYFGDENYDALMVMNTNDGTFPDVLGAEYEHDDDDIWNNVLGDEDVVIETNDIVMRVKGNSVTTGDNTNIAGYVAAGIGSLTVGGYLFLRSRRKEEQE